MQAPGWALRAARAAAAGVGDIFQLVMVMLGVLVLVMLGVPRPPPQGNGAAPGLSW